MKGGRLLLASALGMLLACTDSETGAPPMVDAPPPAPPPDVQAAPGFGDGPLEGFLSLDPPDDGGAWSYRVDLNEDGVFDQEGALARPIAFAYRFTEPGLHLVLVILEGPTGERAEVRLPVIVNDPSAVRTVRETTVEKIDPEGFGIFEGVAVDANGDFLYLGVFGSGAVHRLDATSLEVVDRLREPTGLAPDIEGLSVTPSGRFLVANFKRRKLMVIELDSFEVLRLFANRFDHGRFYVEAIDDRLALHGLDVFSLTDFTTGEEVRRYSPADIEFFSSQHFDVASDGTRAAVSENDGNRIDIVRLPELRRERTLQVPGPERRNLVALDATGTKVYVLMSGQRDRLVALDIETGDVLTDIVLDSPGCSSLCAANPTARSLDGRYVAFETTRGVLFVDTVTDLPAFRSSPQSSVAASPVENVIYALSSSGRVRVLEIEP